MDVDFWGCGQRHQERFTPHLIASGDSRHQHLQRVQVVFGAGSRRLQLGRRRGFTEALRQEVALAGRSEGDDGAR